MADALTKSQLQQLSNPPHQNWSDWRRKQFQAFMALTLMGAFTMSVVIAEFRKTE